MTVLDTPADEPVALSVPAATAVVDPAALLEADTTSVGGYVAQAKAASTRETYAKDLRGWAAWCASRGISATLPADPLDVARHLAAMADDGRSPKYIARRLAAINAAHREARLPLPGDSEGVRQTLRGIRRSAVTERGYVPKRARALSTDRIRALVSGLPDGLAGVRDRAMILLGFALGLRASDLCWLRIEDFTEVDGGLDVLLRHSKTDQQGHGVTLPLAEGVYEATDPVRAVQALRAALAERGYDRGSLFRSVHRGRYEALGEKGLTTRSVSLILKRAAVRAGVSAEGLSSHSLRRGMATTAFARGEVDEASIMRSGRWSSLVVRQYNEVDRWRTPASGGLGL
ncbi:site-specific integrase [Geodermatophilus sp. SYSU D00079]